MKSEIKQRWQWRSDSNSFAKNYEMCEMVQRAHIRNSLYLSRLFQKQKISTTHLSGIMLKKSRGEIFRPSKLKDYLEQRDGYVEDTDMKEKNQSKGIAKV
jgi:hypothetical protein